MVAPAEFSAKLLALKATAVGDSFTLVTEMVNSSVRVLLPESVAVKDIAYEVLVSKSVEIVSFSFKVLPTISKETASVPANV